MRKTRPSKHQELRATSATKSKGRRKIVAIDFAKKHKDGSVLSTPADVAAVKPPVQGGFLTPIVPMHFVAMAAGGKPIVALQSAVPPNVPKAMPATRLGPAGFGTRRTGNFSSKTQATDPLTTSAAASIPVQTTVTQTLDAAKSGPEGKDTKRIIEDRISERPADISDAARALANEFDEQINLLKKSKPNDQGRLGEYNDLLAIFEKMASGLKELADAIERAVGDGIKNSPEPVFLGKAADIAHQLNLGLMEWLEQNRTKVFDYPFKIGVYGAGIYFLNSIGVQSHDIFSFITGLILGQTSKSGTTNNSKARKAR